jgi:hypothetical protein
MYSSMAIYKEEEETTKRGGVNRNGLRVGVTRFLCSRRQLAAGAASNHS